MSDDVEQERERRFWELSAGGDEASVRASVWGPTSVDPEAWDASVAPCLAQVLPALRAALGRKKGRILDLGCGPGRLAVPVAQALPRATVVGVDVSQGMLDAARRTFAEALCDNFELIHCDGRVLPDAVGELAAAYSVITLQHVPWEAACQYVFQVAALLRSGGIFRFQFVEGAEDVFLSRQFREADVLEVVADAGLRVDAVDRAVVFPTWTWVTAVKV